jgi:hypothetical protein
LTPNTSAAAITASRSAAAAKLPDSGAIAIATASELAVRVAVRSAARPWPSRRPTRRSARLRAVGGQITTVATPSARSEGDRAESAARAR